MPRILYRLSIQPALVVVVLASMLHAQRPKHWVATWTAAQQQRDVPIDTMSGIQGRTVRNVIGTSIGGQRERIGFTNEFGTTSLVIGAAHITLVNAEGEIITSTDRVITFAGKTSVTLPPGAPLLSDEVLLDLPRVEGLQSAFTCLRVQVHLRFMSLV